jgi:cobyrinic acid a,c-diamide synthase
MDLARTRIPRLLIGGVSSGVGKSLFMTGLIVALRKQGMSVSCCVTGSSLHQALIYTRLSRRYSHVIDRAILDTDQVITTLKEAERGADIVLIDGEQGFYDGVAPGDEFGSDADIVRFTRTPTVLVANIPSFSNSVAAIMKGFCHFSDKDLIQGLVANRVVLGEEVGPILSHPVLESLNASMDAYGLPRFIAGIPPAHFETPIPPVRCWQRENVTALPREFFLDVASLVSNHIYADELLAIAELAPELSQSQEDGDMRVGVSRIAVSDDVCFNVAYQDNLAWLSRYGAEIIPFSPLADIELPKNIGGIYITGGYLDSYAEELSRNERIRQAIKNFADKGGVVYSEGAGTAYLCQSYQIAMGQTPYPGVGVIPCDAVRISTAQGIVRATLVEDSILGVSGGQIRGISTGEWGIQGASSGSLAAVMHTMRMGVGEGLPFNEGLSWAPQALSTFQFFHFGANQLVARALVDAAAAVILS